MATKILDREKTIEADGKTFYCSFCGCSQWDVDNLIQGPSVFICDSCVSLCVEILDAAISGKS